MPKVTGRAASMIEAILWIYFVVNHLSDQVLQSSQLDTKQEELNRAAKRLTLEQVIATLTSINDHDHDQPDSHCLLPIRISPSSCRTSSEWRRRREWRSQGISGSGLWWILNVPSPNFSVGFFGHTVEWCDSNHSVVWVIWSANPMVYGKSPNLLRFKRCLDIPN